MFHPVIIITMNIVISIAFLLIVIKFPGDHHFRPNPGAEKRRCGSGKCLLSEAGVDVDDLETASDAAVQFVKALSGSCVVRNVDAPVEGRIRGGEEAVDGIEVEKEEEEEWKEERGKKLAVRLAEATRCCFSFCRVCF